MQGTVKKLEGNKGSLVIGGKTPRVRISDDGFMKTTFTDPDTGDPIKLHIFKYEVSHSVGEPAVAKLYCYHTQTDIVANKDVVSKCCLWPPPPVIENECWWCKLKRIARRIFRRK